MVNANDMLDLLLDFRMHLAAVLLAILRIGAEGQCDNQDRQCDFWLLALLREALAMVVLLRSATIGKRDASTHIGVMPRA